MDKKHNRPEFPKRAIITGGMPYGNKELHFGHIGGMYVHADFFARFLRDRIGKENVIFVSGTDCYGSPILEDWRKSKENNEFQGTIQDFVKLNHDKQKTILNKYQISLNIFAASGIGRSKEIHADMCSDFFLKLQENGYLIKKEMPQFYDPEKETFLNGRQVEGQCPINGCQSERGYADECSLGHQYDPSDLKNPKSKLSGQRPIMKNSTNYYIDILQFSSELRKWIEREENTQGSRSFYISSLLEFFEPPIIHIKKNYMDLINEIRDQLPPHRLEEGKKKSYKMIFEKLEERERACSILTENKIHFRNGKTLVPFRLTGNSEWGIPVPGHKDLTFWVWPESIWAPISFTSTFLEKSGSSKEDWSKWWKSRECKVYQFIGEDNIYFYGIAGMPMFMGDHDREPCYDPEEGQLQLPQLIANNHILFLDKKASSSGKIKPPTAGELLEHYTSDQLRTHFLSLGLGVRSVGFKPKPLNPSAKEKDGDPVLKEGNLLSNVLNRAVRSCFYTIQKYFDNKIPVGEISKDIIEEGNQSILDYEEAAYRHEFHIVIAIIDQYIRNITKYWAYNSKNIEKDDDIIRLKQTIINTFHMVRVSAVLVHPIAPEGSEMIREYLNFDESFWSWDHIFENIYFFMKDPENHQVKFLKPRTDFFQKHPSQLK